MGDAEDVFEGPAVELPEPMERSRALYRPESEVQPPVRHARGYAPFVAFCREQDVDAAQLGTDPARLVEFLHSSGGRIANDSALEAAAGMFAGNVLASLRPDAQWRTFEGSSPTVGNDDLQFEIEGLPTRIRDADAEWLQGFISVIQEWESEEAEVLPAMQLQPVPPAPGQPPYIRPALPVQEFSSPDGQPTPYGSRWGDEGPPAEAYTMDSNTERFAGLHTVARALIEHLCEVYDVDVDPDPERVPDLLVHSDEVREAVRLRPRDPGAAVLTFGLTSYPGVVVHAGLLHEFIFPSCGCDACDETAESEADRLERLVLAVAAGGYGERYPVGRRGWSEYALTAADGSWEEGGRGEPDAVAGIRLRDAELKLQEVPEGWRPWPLRTS